METYGNALGLCDDELGYYGVMCSMCLPGYREYKGKCSKCNYAIDKYITAGTLIIFILLIVFMVKNVLKSAIKENTTTSVMSKILVNHMQMLIITASFDMNWPDVV